jgi:FMN phosphatase YigB (HAD superfamily)
MTGQPLPEVDAVVFDVGETLVDESRAWADAAERAGVTPFALVGVLGALIERGEPVGTVWDVLGVPRPERLPVEDVDLYPDAVGCLVACRDAGLRVGIAGNQPAGVERELLAAGLRADFVASSAAWGVAKPSAAFFDRVVEHARVPAGRILYVGDRLDNDVLPARAAGMRTALLRRGPWGYLHHASPGAQAADLRIDSLDDLVAALRRPDRR